MVDASVHPEPEDETAVDIDSLLKDAQSINTSAFSWRELFDFDKNGLIRKSVV